MKVNVSFTISIQAAIALENHHNKSDYINKLILQDTKPIELTEFKRRGCRKNIVEQLIEFKKNHPDGLEYNEDNIIDLT